MSLVRTPLGTSTSLLMMKKYAWLVFCQYAYAYSSCQRSGIHQTNIYHEPLEGKTPSS